ncbi:MAG: hypothetical protein WD294_03295 [Phycisphaeraceae bacterium]
MRITVFALGFCIFATALTGQLHAGVIVGTENWSGSRTINADGTGIGITENFHYPIASMAPAIHWDISYDTSTQRYTYAYSFTYGGSALQPSHFIVQLSEDYQPNDQNFAFVQAPESWTAGVFSAEQGSADVTMPNPIHGVKLDAESSTYTIVSERGPVWGDFFWKKGSGARAQDGWNMGLESGIFPEETMTDFTDWIPVPNSHTGNTNLIVLPTPAAAPLGLMLLGGLMMRRKRIAA